MEGAADGYAASEARTGSAPCSPDPAAAAGPLGAVDVQALVAANSLAGLPAIVALLLGAVLLMDGFDLAVAGFAAPAILSHFRVDTTQMGIMLAAGNAGLGMGAIAGGLLGDRAGRRPVILLGAILYSGATGLCAIAPDFGILIALRAAAGLGLGAITPTVATVLMETMPARWRASLSILAFTMVTVGAVLSGIAAKVLLPIAGWQALFVIGGLVPMLAIVPVLYAVLPETPAFMVRARRPGPAIATVLNRLCKARLAGDEDFHLAEGHAGRSGRTTDLFRQHGRDTLALWIVCAGVMFASVAFTNTGTLLVGKLGRSAAEAVNVILAYTVAGLAGGLVASASVRRWGSRPVTAVAAAGTLMVLLVLASPVGEAWLLPLVALGGFGLGGLTVISFPLAANVYPVAIRTRGAGAASAVSRVAAVAGAAITGKMLSVATPDLVFRTLAAVMAACLVAALALRRHLSATAPRTAPDQHE